MSSRGLTKSLMRDYVASAVHLMDRRCHSGADQAPVRFWAIA